MGEQDLDKLKKQRWRFLRYIISTGFVAGAIFHLSKIGLGYQTVSLWRHGFFAVVDAGISFCVIVFPRASLFIMSGLLIQQFFTHGYRVFAFELPRIFDRLFDAGVICFEVFAIVVVLFEWRTSQFSYTKKVLGDKEKK